jgi:HK97 family phage major capsid protein
MKNIVEMLQSRAKITADIRSVVDVAETEKRELSVEDNEKIAKLEADFDKVSKEIDLEQRQQEREKAGKEIFNKPIDAGLDSRADDKSAEVRAAFNKALAGYGESEYRALQADNATQAGYLIAPQQFSTELIKEIDNIFFIRSFARKFPLVKAASLGFPKMTARMAKAARGSEIGAPTADSTLAFGKREFIPKYLTAEILLSKPLLRNAAVDPEVLVRQELAYAFGVTEETEFCTGTGAGEALGVFTASADGISTARDVSTGNTTTSITFDGLLEAKYKLASQYRPKARWIFHRDGVKQIAKLKNGEGQYIWQASVQVGQPDMILGFPAHESEYAPNTFTTGLYVGILGDFNYYWIVDVLNVEIQVLFELYARTNQVDFIARAENDAMPVLEAAFSRVKLA